MDDSLVVYKESIYILYKVLSDFCLKVVWKLSVPEYICLKNLGVLPSYCLVLRGYSHTLN